MSTVTPLRETAAAQEVPSRWAALRRRLQQRRAEYERQRQQALADTVASEPDAVAVALSVQLSRTMEEIDAALARIEAGTYGRCISCGIDIPGARLESRPFAAACVPCQQRAA